MKSVLNFFSQLNPRVYRSSFFFVFALASLLLLLCPFASLPRCPRCLVASLPRCLVASLPRCLVASLLRCLVALLPLGLGLGLGLALGLGPWPWPWPWPAKRIFEPLVDMHERLQRRSGIRGYLGEAFYATNGIMRGDPLSVLLLNAIVGVSTLDIEVKTGGTVANQSYVDDITLLTRSSGQLAKENVRVWRGLRT